MKKKTQLGSRFGELFPRVLELKSVLGARVSFGIPNYVYIGSRVSFG